MSSRTQVQSDMGDKKLQKRENRNHIHNPNFNKRSKKLNSDTAANAHKFSVLGEISGTSLFDDSLALTEKDDFEKEQEKNHDDLISHLPEEILFHIISFLPFQSAFNIRALSTQWNNLWLCYGTLIKHGYPDDLVPTITEFLNQFNDDLGSWKKSQRFQFHFSEYQNLLASVGLNRKLHLDFSQVEGGILRKFWGLEKNPSPYIYTFIHKLSPSLSFVKSLKLTSLNYYPTPNICISNLELLESLVIIRCNAVELLCISDVPKLQNIIVSDCPLLKGLYIEGTSELGSLRIRGNLPSYIRLQGNFSLKDVILEGPYYNAIWSDSLQQEIGPVKILTLCRWIFEKWFCTVQFCHLKDLWWIDSSVDERNIDALISFLKNCPSLERLFITIDPTSCGMRSTSGKSPNNARSYTKQGHLKGVKVENLIDEEGAIFLAEKLLEAFDIENLVVVASNGNCLRSLVRIPVKQATQKGKFYKFVEDFEDNSGLRLKHAHMGFRWN